MSETLSVGSNISHYRILSKLGAGGMGEVFLAEDTRLGRKVALKVLPAAAAANQERMRRFVQEAKAASALNHPAIAHIYEIGEAEGIHFIAMEYVEGATLREKIHGDKPDLKTLLKYLAQVADGLAKAHAAGIVHRDLKPDNVMVTPDGFAKILDFGLAKLVETEKPPGAAGAEEINEAATAMMSPPLSTPGIIMGTAGYMSPEQTQGKPDIDQRSDIFSFGCVLFEAATGRQPFTGDSVIDTLHRITRQNAPPLRDFNPEAPADLQRIVRRCLQKDPEERYQSIKDVAIELRELRREMTSNDELHYSAAPQEQSPPKSTNAGSDESATAILPAGGATAGTNRPAAQKTDEASRVYSTSSAEYIAGEVRKHKPGVALVSLILLALLGVGLWFFYLRPSSTGNTPIDSIAVLPFQNRSADADTEYLSDGLAESLIYRLSQLPNLKVSPTSSVFRYKGKEPDAQKIGSELGVSAVMSGRIVQRGEQLTISVELVDVRTGKLIWGEQYERKLSELLATQREIAAAITQKLQLKLSGGERGLTKKYTDNNEAYQLYLRARFHFGKRTKEDLLRSIELFREAIRLDPNFALAHVGVAESYMVMPSRAYMSPHEAMPQAKAAVARALELDAELPEAHTVAGNIACVYDWNWAEGERRFKRALELDPNLANTHYRYAWVYLSPLGRHDEAINEMKRAMELEPLSLIHGANFGAVYMYARQFDAALEQARKTYELDPNHVGARDWMCMTLNAKGMYDESLLIAEKSLQTHALMLAQAGYSYAKSGQRRRAEAVIARWKEDEKTTYVMNYWVAIVYAALGERDAAFTELEKAYQARDWHLQRLKTDPFMDSLRDDPRFKAMLKRMNLPE